MNDLEMPGDLPLPDLDLDLDLPEPPAPAASAGRFSVHIGAIRDPVDAAPQIASILGVDAATAARLCVAAPGTLVSDLPRAEAERVAGAIRALAIPARVEGSPPTGSAPPSQRPRPASAHPAPSAPPPGRHSGRAHDLELDHGEPPSFWPQAPVAFLAPFLGKGALLLVAAGVTGVLTVAVAAAPGLLLKLGALVFVAFVGLGLHFETFNRLAQAAMARDEDAWLPDPQSDLPGLSALFFRGLLLMAVGALLAVVPVLVGWGTRDAAATLAAVSVLQLYWPMALTVMSVSGRALGALDFPVVLRAIVVAPLEYIAVCALTLGAIVGSTLAVGMASGAGALALGAADSQPGVLSGLTLLAFMSFLWFAGIAYFHGVMGYLMGALIRSKGERYHFLME